MKKPFYLYHFLSYGFLSLAPCIIVCLIYFIGYIPFEQNVAGKLKQAADANSIALAKEKLDEVIEHLEKNDLTEGSTHIFIKYPQHDIGYFYKNLKSASNDLTYFLSDKNSDKSKLAESNQLIKLRETLTDQDGTVVSYPPSLPYYPYQLLMSLALFASGFWIFFVWIVLSFFYEVWL